MPVHDRTAPSFSELSDISRNVAGVPPKPMVRAETGTRHRPLGTSSSIFAVDSSILTIKNEDDEMTANRIPIGPLAERLGRGRASNLLVADLRAHMSPHPRAKLWVARPGHAPLALDDDWTMRRVADELNLRSVSELVVQRFCFASENPNAY